MLLSLYQLAWRPAAAVIARGDAQRVHDRTVALMRRGDGLGPLTSLAGSLGGSVLPAQPTLVGGVRLPRPIIVAAGLVKGEGFGDEVRAMAAVGEGRDIVPGWRSVPALLGPVEFGSFTRHPRLGHRGRVVWRDDAARSMHNRIGLRNPGARAAAAYLGAHSEALPQCWGINLAVSPGVSDVRQARVELGEAAACFHDALGNGRRQPAWLTLNLSCPNTDDDPHGAQSADLARELCGVLTESSPIPVWVKVGPDLSDAQLTGLAAAFDEARVSAVVATNTWAQPVRDSGASAGKDGVSGVSAGTSGARLRPLALQTVSRLHTILASAGTDIDIVACGGILDGGHWQAFQDAGARAAMIYSAMVFRGPLVAALILREAARAGRHA